MKVKIIDISQTQKEIEITLFPEEIRNYLEKASEIISFEKNIKGFRPGKAPKEVIEQNFGKEIIWKKASLLASEDYFLKIVKEHQFNLVSTPKIEIPSIEVEKSVFYRAFIEILPKIILPDYKKIAKEVRKEKKEVKIEEEEIEKVLKFLQESRALLKAVNRGAKEGDEVVINFEAKINDMPQKGTKIEKLRIVLGKERIMKGFDKQLINLKRGESKVFSLEKGSDGTQKNKITFSVKMLEIFERKIPELTDEFARSLGSFSNLDDLKEKLKRNLKIEKEGKERERIRRKIIEAIAKETQVEAPPSLVKKELNNMIDELKISLSQNGVSFEEYLEKSKNTEEKLKKEWQGEAERRIIFHLILQEIGKKEKIEIPEKEVTERANYYLNRYHVPPSQLPDPKELKLYIRNLLINERVFQLLEGESIS